MSAWVETLTYAGPCRRASRNAFRLTDRRRRDTAAETPSLPTLLRRLRMTSLNFATRADRQRFEVTLSGAILLAERSGSTGCKLALEEARQLFQFNGRGALVDDAIARAAAALV
jgi:hypothetical protein